MKPAGTLLPRSGKRRAVIAGGGWGGMTAARHIRNDQGRPTGWANVDPLLYNVSFMFDDFAAG
jgi:NADH dehydrogenase FAD-containing subunit